ncbi:hypothetical protein IWW50_003640 [Coemansia erecta]|nr:hypothetical protein IWW50_003640 [Coemansia erecta]
MNNGKDDEARDKAQDSAKRPAIGPTMPPVMKKDASEDEDEDEDEIGPSLGLAGCSSEQAQQQTLDRLDAQMERSNPDTAEVNGRGEWMLVPPPAKHGDQTSDAAMFDESWTLTPEQRRAKSEKKAPVKRETLDTQRKREEDRERASWVEEYNRTQRPKSLMEMHQESKTKKTKHGKRSRDGNKPGDEDEWKRQRFSKDRDLASAPRPGNNSRQQNAVLDAIDSLGDKYKSGSFL